MIIAEDDNKLTKEKKMYTLPKVNTIQRFTSNKKISVASIDQFKPPYTETP